MLNIPETLKIGWRNYKIIQGEHRSGDGGGDLMGQISYYDREIYLYEKLEAEQKNVTLLHEVTHGILFNMGSELRSDELFVTAFTENLYQVMLDNPEMFKFKKKK